jgi:methanogenic corrinoid protein MtbC1
LTQILYTIDDIQQNKKKLQSPENILSMDNFPTLGDSIDNLQKSLISLDRVAVEKILRSPENNQSPMTMIENIVVPALERIGQGWENGQVSLAQVYMSGRIIEEMIDKLLPTGHRERKNQPPMAIVVLEDHHLLGKRIVYSALRASGFELMNYGQMNVETVVKNVKADGIRILLVSVLMLPSALRIKNLRELLNKTASPVKLIVGGAPFRYDSQLWQEVGADAMGINPSDAVELVKKFMQEIL